MFTKASPSGTGCPSTTTNGVAPALTELIPLIVIFGAAPASEDIF
jgi:hypothetical protein